MRHRRRGLSLVELSVTIAVTTLGMGIVGMGIASLLRVDARFRNASAATADLPLLRQALRFDLHAADDCVLNGETLTLTGEAPVTYTRSGGDIQRDAAGSRRRYGVPEGVSWSLQEETIGNARLVRVTFSLGENDRPPITQLIAELGRHGRLTTGAGEGGT